MSSRPNIRPFKVIPAVSMTSAIIGQITVATLVSYLSYTIVWSGTPVGTLTVEACNDAQYDPNGAYIAGTGTWIPIYMSINGTTANSIAVSGAGNALVDIDGIAAGYVRLHYVPSSSTGTLTATVVGKVS